MALEQASDNIREQAARAERAYDDGDLQACFDALIQALTLAEREGTPRGISTGLVLDLTLELFTSSDLDAGRELFERWWSLAAQSGAPSELTDPQDRTLLRQVRELVALPPSFSPDVAAVIAGALLHDDLSQALDRVVLFAQLRPDIGSAARTQLCQSAPELLAIFASALAGRTDDGLESRSPPMKLIYCALVMAILILGQGARSLCGGTDETSYVR
jgi:hypothetical protein